MGSRHPRYLSGWKPCAVENYITLEGNSFNPVPTVTDLASRCQFSSANLVYIGRDGKFNVDGAERWDLITQQQVPRTTKCRGVCNRASAFLKGEKL